MRSSLNFAAEATRANLRKNSLVTFFLVTLVWMAGPLQAAESPDDTLDLNQTSSGGKFEATVYVGFDTKAPYRRDQTWVPVTVEFNNGDEVIEGSLMLKLKEGQEIYKTPVQLTPRSRKTYSLLLFIPELLDEIEFYLETRRETIPVQRVTVATALSENERYMAVLSDQHGSHNFMEDFQSEDIDRPLEVFYTDPKLMPRSWIGYQNIDVLLWDNGPTTALSSAQQEALDHWIQMGGTLILAAGDSWPQLNESPFQLYMPITINGSQVLNTGTELECPVDESRTLLGSTLVAATGSLINDPNITLWLQAGNVPFLVERRWGAGRIYWVASALGKPLFQNRSFQETLVHFLTDGKTIHTNDIMNQFDSSISQFLRWMIQAELPSTWFIAGYLGIYILIIVPINYLIFRAIRRLEWAWLTVPIWAILFAYGAYYIGALRQQGAVTVNEVSLIEALPQAKYGHATTYTSIYSPVRRWYTLDFSSPPVFPLIPISFDPRMQRTLMANETLTINFLDENQTRVEDYLIYHWSQRILKSQHSTSLGNGVDISFTFENETARGTLTNQTGYVLKDPRMFIRGKTFVLDEIAVGETVTVDRGTHDMEPYQLDQKIQQYTQVYGYGHNPRERRGLDYLINNQLQDAYPAYYISKYENLNTGLLLARIDQPQLHFQIQGESVEPNGAAMLCISFPIEQVLHGQTKIPGYLWNFSTSKQILSRFSGRMGGMQNMGMAYYPPNANQDTITVGGNNANNKWDLVTQVPISNAEILSMQMVVNYADLFRNIGYGPGMGGYGGPNPGMNSPVEMVDGKPVKPENELKLLNRYTNQYEPLSKITQPDGTIQTPHRYIDQKLGRIGMSLSIPGDNWITISKAAIVIELIVDYDAVGSSSFLGQSLVTISETVESSMDEGADNDTN